MTRVSSTSWGPTSRSRSQARPAGVNRLSLARTYLIVGDRVIAVLVGFAVLLLYVSTLAPTIVAGDAGELVTAAYELGVAHPPGYPLWTVLNHGFIMIAGPGTDVAARVNLFSAICGALSCVLAYGLARRLGAGQAAALGGALLLGASHELWAQSVIAEVYALNLLLFMGCLWFLAKWDRDRRNRWLFVFSALLGLGLANHHTIGILGPAGLAFVLWRNWRVILDWRLIVGSVTLFVLPLSLYVYLPLASSSAPYMDWGHPRSFDALIEHITRAQYTQSYEPQTRHFTSFFFQFIQLGRDLLRQFSPIVGLTGLALLPIVLHRRRCGWIPLAILGIGMALTLVWVLNTKFERQEVQANQVFFIPVYACLAVLFAGVLDGLIRRVKARLRLRGQPHLTVLVVGAVALAPAGLAVAHNYSANDFSSYWYAEDHARNLMATVAHDGVIFPSGDHNTFPLIYLQRVEKKRPDITIADKYGYIEARLFPKLDKQTDKLELDRGRVIRYLLTQTDRPVYFTVKQPLPGGPGTEGVKQVQTGLLYRVAKEPSSKAPASYWQDYRYRNSDELRDPPDYGAVNVAADFFFFRGLEELRAGKPDQALAAFAEARKLSYGVKQVMNNIGSALAEHGLIGPAQRYYDLALRLDQEYESALWNQARTVKQVGQYDRAVELFNRLRKLHPEDFRVPGELGFLYLTHFNLTRRARKLFNASLALNPDQPQIKRAKRIIGDQPGALPQPVLKAARLEHSFGQVVLGQKQETTIQIENVSDQTLVLDAPRADCDCTHGSLKDKTLKPGDATTLVITFHETKRLGKQRREVTVTPNQGPALTVRVTAKVVHPIASKPVKIAIAEALPGQVLKREVIFTSRMNTPFTVAEVTSNVSGLSRISESQEPSESLKPSESPASTRRRKPSIHVKAETPPDQTRSIMLKIETGATPGKRTGKLTVTFQDKTLATLEVPVAIHVRKPARLEPRSLFLNDLQRGGKQTYPVMVDLAEGLDAKVTGVIPSDSWITLIDPPRRLSGQKTLTVQLDTDALPETFNGTLTVETDSDIVPTVVVPIYGFAR